MPQATPVNVDNSAAPISFAAVGRKKVTAAFDGGRLTSDASVLLLAQAERAMGNCARLADPRSFCIQKTMQDIAHGGEHDQNLMFAGHAAYRFKQDPFYSNNFTPTVKQLVDRILIGD